MALVVTAKPEIAVTELPPGLSEREAAERLEAEGYNQLPSAEPRGWFSVAAEVLREPMFFLLIAIGVIYLVLGDIQEAMALLVAIFLIIGITFYQQNKTERALQALRDLSSPRALVIREGRQKRIAGREVVRGDIVMLSEGDRVSADAVVLSSLNLTTDESLLTGESVPVRKMAWDGEQQPGPPGGDDQPFVYSGTLVVRGQGVARVQATGLRTEIGKIGKALETLTVEDTALQKETRRLVRLLALLGLGLCALVTVLYALTRGNVLQGILAGLTLAISMVPEEFPVVLTIFLALGAWRISQRRVLTRRVPAIEMLGAATVLCVDKTGTLTLNQMAIRRIFSQGAFHDLDSPTAQLPERLHLPVEFGILASAQNPFDPMEKAFHALGPHLAGFEQRRRGWRLRHAYPLSSALLAMTQVWEIPAESSYVVAAKGAPEAIAGLCRFSDAQWQELEQHVRSMAAEGLRVLGVARALHARADLPEGPQGFDFEFLGLVGLADPVRPGVPDAIRECKRAGIRVVMVTGDYPVTAAHIGREIGLERGDEVVTGAELTSMDDAELQRRIRTAGIFARVVPEQKLRLVNALKAIGEVVAMTGDGVNDAPALKAAHIGIAMGGRGTDVAREAAALVLMDDDFSSLVAAVRLGRRIHDNLKKAMGYVLALHAPIAGLALIPVALRWPLMLLPIHVLFLELITDPACSVVFEAEPEEKDVMDRPPRDSRQPLFTRRMVGQSLLQGVNILAIVLAVLAAAIYSGQDETRARALTFTTLILANLGLIFVNRSWSDIAPRTLLRRNPMLWWITGATLATLALLLYVPPLQSLFRVSALSPSGLLVCVSAAALSVAGFELLKLWRRIRGARTAA
ncbi:MAG: cation-translocating P-type ATPase [Terriglobales bacterium]